MSDRKKQIRAAFRQAVFDRDNHRCKVCREPDAGSHDAHHITDRTLMPNGGYVKENGITLCPPCHEKAEEFHRTGTAILDFAPGDLYALIKSSHDLAIKASERLSRV